MFAGEFVFAESTARGPSIGGRDGRVNEQIILKGRRFL